MDEVGSQSSVVPVYLHVLCVLFCTYIHILTCKSLMYFSVYERLFWSETRSLSLFRSNECAANKYCLTDGTCRNHMKMRWIHSGFSAESCDVMCGGHPVYRQCDQKALSDPTMNEYKFRKILYSLNLTVFDAVVDHTTVNTDGPVWGGTGLSPADADYGKAYWNAGQLCSAGVHPSYDRICPCTAQVTEEPGAERRVPDFVVKDL